MDIIWFGCGRKLTKEEYENRVTTGIIIFGGGTLILLIFLIRACLIYYFGI